MAIDRLYTWNDLRDVNTGDNTGLTIRVQTDNSVLPITVDEFKQYGNVHITSDDALIADIIRAVKDYGEAYTRMTWYNKTIIAEWETHGQKVILPVGPHIDVLEVKRIYADGTEQTLTNGSDFLVSGTEFKFLNFFVWNYGLRVTFTAGYGTNASDLPSDLKLGVYKACLSAYEDRQNLAEGGFTSLPMGSRAFFSTRKRIVL
jgi:uncharacterized phiE125 gp8 family phage protein